MVSQADLGYLLGGSFQKVVTKRELLMENVIYFLQEYVIFIHTITSIIMY